MNISILKSNPPYFFLAPLASYTDLPFRSVVKKFGCDMTFSEMINVNAIVYNNEKTKKMMQKSPIEKPYFVQIAANNVENAVKDGDYIEAYVGRCHLEGTVLCKDGTFFRLDSDHDMIGMVEIKTVICAL